MGELDMEMEPEAIEREYLLVCIAVLINKAVTYYYKFNTKSPNQCRNLV
jgi:hypothetical protein